MADNTYESLLKDKEKKGALECDVSFKVSSSEMETLTKKAESLEMSIGELIRIYVVKTPLLDGSVFDKSKGKKNRNTAVNKGGEE